MKKQNLRTVSLVVVTFTYLLIGAAIFGYLESEHEVRQRETLELIELIVKRKYNISDDDFTVLTTTVIKSVPHKAGIQWKFPGAFYFATTVVTTIGYGHSTPATVAGRSFCMIYALIGIPLGLVMFQSIGERLNTAVGYLLKHAKRCFKAKNTEVTQTNLVMFVLVLSTLLMTGMAWVFATCERWDYFDALYYCFITLTTIGFGDFVALQKDSALQSKPEYVVCSILFILLGLSVVSSAVNLLVLKFLTLNTEDERRDEQLRYTATLNPIKLEGDVITSGQQNRKLLATRGPSMLSAGAGSGEGLSSWQPDEEDDGDQESDRRRRRHQYQVEESAAAVESPERLLFSGPPIRGGSSFSCSLRSSGGSSGGAAFSTAAGHLDSGAGNRKRRFRRADRRSMSQEDFCGSHGYAAAERGSQREEEEDEEQGEGGGGNEEEEEDEEQEVEEGAALCPVHSHGHRKLRAQCVVCHHHLSTELDPNFRPHCCSRRMQLAPPFPQAATQQPPDAIEPTQLLLSPSTVSQSNCLEFRHHSQRPAPELPVQRPPHAAAAAYQPSSSRLPLSEPQRRPLRPNCALCGRHQAPDAHSTSATTSASSHNQSRGHRHRHKREERNSRRRHLHQQQQQQPVAANYQSESQRLADFRCLGLVDTLRSDCCSWLSVASAGARCRHPAGGSSTDRRRRAPLSGRNSHQWTLDTDCDLAPEQETRAPSSTANLLAARVLTSARNKSCPKPELATFNGSPIINSLPPVAGCSGEGSSSKRHPRGKCQLPAEESSGESLSDSRLRLRRPKSVELSLAGGCDCCCRHRECIEQALKSGVRPEVDSSSSSRRQSLVGRLPLVASQHPIVQVAAAEVEDDDAIIEPGEKQRDGFVSRETSEIFTIDLEGATLGPARRLEAGDFVAESEEEPAKQEDNR